MDLRGWERADVILFSADAYVDHPSFGAAVVGRILEAEGLRVCIVPQPSWHGDLRDFKRLGRPRLFFGVSPGCMDSMVNKYTAAKRLRSEDAYSPDGRHDMRPEYPTIVYSECIRKLFPDVPIVLGGIEASLRRLMHYDYWQDRMRPSVLCDTDADLITYGMGDKVNVDLAHRLMDMLDSYDDSLGYDSLTGESLITRASFRKAIVDDDPLPQTVSLHRRVLVTEGDILLHSYEECLKDLKLHADNFRHIEEESNSIHACRLIQKTGDRYVVVNPPYPPLTMKETDYSFDLPYTRLPHPKYRGKRIPAYEMIKFSVNIHRGCFGGCAFCTISAHQGKFVMNRSKESVMREIDKITSMPDFHGTLTDLGGPSANMYMMHGKNMRACEKCKRPSCIFPAICPNMNGDHAPLLDIYRSVMARPKVKHCYIGSGVRYDMLLCDWKDERLNKSAREYTRQLILHHVSGRLKVAPEHTEDKVLDIMRKPSFAQFHKFKDIFDAICRKAGKRQQIIPYFISSHPGCMESDMISLRHKTQALGLLTDQVQDFTPTPMTVATTIYATGYNPYTMERVFCEHNPDKKKKQREYFIK